MRDTVIAHSGNNGITLNGPEVHVENCLVANNAAAGIARFMNVVYVSGSTVTDNVTYGLAGVMSSYGNNQVSGNGTDKQGPITVIPRD